MKRFIVTRQYVKFKGKMYRKGELLPPEFTERDRCRNIYPSRIGTTDVPNIEGDKQEEIIKTTVPPVSATVNNATRGTVSAAKPLSSTKTPTGTPSPKTASISRASISK